MRDGVEVFGQIGVDHVRIAPADQPVRRLDGVERASFGPVPIGAIFKVRLEDRLQHQFGGGLNDPVPDSGNAQRLSPRRPVWESSPAAPASADSSSTRVPRAKPPASLPHPPPRSSRTSLRPRPARRRSDGRARRRIRECRADGSCRRAGRTGRRAPPSPCHRASAEGC